MQQVRRILISVLAIAALAMGATVASAERGGDKHKGHKGKGAAERLFTIQQPDPAANPEGIAVDKRSRAFFVGITAGGDIYRGTLGSDTIVPFIDAAPGKAAIGLKVHRGKLYVAGGPTGAITVYDLATTKEVGTFQTPGTGGFLNDLVVTRRGDVYVTDSFRQTLWHVTPAQVEAGRGEPQALDVSAIPYGAGEFNLNGIVAKGARKLIVVNSSTGKLFRIKLGDDGASIEEIDEIEGATVPGGDGLLLDRGRLVAVQGDPAQLSFIKLRRGARSATLKGTQTNDKLRGPSTVDATKRLYLVVNADFDNNVTPFTVAGLPRKSKRGHDHRDHHGHGKRDDRR